MDSHEKSSLSLFSVGLNVYRLRVGDYRVIYKVFDAKGVILIGRAARRSESTYRGLRWLFEPGRSD
ncbi:type II toxin-antitoxin system RelE/ParE family toxin [Candidatus Bipolaricaulota bacterium]|nr:type II toxin-antitoxin system RelE/ParE family toxin [Candidatus Bipolaricaulota bacterium]